MPRCSECGCEISFRRIDGRIVPIGCSCRRSKAETVVESGRSWQTTCPQCHSAVFFVQHNGGSVWFDELGPPWEKHPCFADGRGHEESDELIRNHDFTNLAVVGRSDIRLLEGGRAVELLMDGPTLHVALTDRALGNEVPIRSGDLVGVDLEKWTLHLQNGRIFKVSWIHLARCAQCGHYFSDQREHMARCRSGRINTCGICGQSVHWTMLSSHVASHRREGPV